MSQKTEIAILRLADAVEQLNKRVADLEAIAVTPIDDGKYRAVHKNRGWFAIVGPDGAELAQYPSMRQADAALIVNELNAG